MPLSPRIIQGLHSIGLESYEKKFSILNDADFLGMRMNDFPTYGVEDPEQKQRLYRLQKLLIEESKSQRAAAPPLPLKGAAPNARALDTDLLDLDAHDSDLLAHACGPAMQLSPMGDKDKPKSAAQPDPNQPEVDPPKIRVVVRKRPINRKEKDKGEEDIVEVNMDRSFVVVNETKLKVDLTKYMEKHQFNFDESLDETVSNEDVYRFTVQPLVHTLFRNGKASCFAYGQTGSGKTYTMGPLPVRAAADIFRYLAKPEYREVNLYVSCFEIYGNKVFDLCNHRKKLNILEDGKKRVVVVGLKEYEVSSVETLKQLIDTSGKERSTGSTAANADSSRSHSIMQFALKHSGPEGRLIGKISFIDLAGSERGADTFDNNRQTRLEGAEINKSLLALKECIRALDSDARHVPFRGSKLTAVLRDSFVGETARTVMIANISPNSLSVEHTLNTLRYADRVKELRKDKAERAPGGVTPGEDPNYYAAVARAEVRERSPVKEVKSRPRSDSRSNQAAEQHSYDDMDDDDDADDAILSEHDKMLDTILQEEELLLTAHRLHIEETMELVRSEMNLLAEVDQPGSAIDQYVERLDAILKQKLEGVEALKAKLDRFKDHLKQEEMITATVRPGPKGFRG